MPAPEGTATGVTFATGEGGVTATWFVAVLSVPFECRIVNVAVYVPVWAYVCVAVGDGGGPAPVASAVPSPNERSHDVIPVPTPLADPSKDSESGDVPEQSLSSSAAGALVPPEAATSMVHVLTAVLVLLSVMVSVAE